MVYTFIINPRAGGGLLRSRRRAFEEALARSGIEHRVLTTERPKHASELAKAAAATSRVLVAVGGDGTVHEVVSGIIDSAKDVPLGIIPAGSGNDFAKMFDIPKRMDAAIAAIAAAHPRPVDYGRVRWDGPAGSGSGIFVNAAGTGIDAKVAEAATGIKLLTGTARYLGAVFMTLRGWTAPMVDVEIFGNGPGHVDLSEQMLTVIVGNGRCAAGGFYLTPTARIDDGMLDACVIRNADIPRVLALIPRVIRGGRHVGEDEVTMELARRVVVRPSRPLPVQADGEILATAATHIEFEVVAGGISVVLPVKR